MFGLVMLLVVTVNLIVTVWVLAKYSAVRKDYLMLESEFNVMQGNVTALADVLRDVARDGSGSAADTTNPSALPGQPAIDADALAQAQQVLANASQEDIDAAAKLLGSLGLGDL